MRFLLRTPEVVPLDGVAAQIAGRRPRTRRFESRSRPQAGAYGSIRHMPTTPAPSPPPLARLGGAGEADLLVVAGGAAPPGGQRLRVPAQIKWVLQTMLHHR